MIIHQILYAKFSTQQKVQDRLDIQLTDWIQLSKSSDTDFDRDIKSVNMKNIHKSNVARKPFNFHSVLKKYTDANLLLQVDKSNPKELYVV